MDPSIEIATLVVSYLWTLRDLFPRATTVAQFDVEELIYDEANRDFALLARLRNIAHRRPSEQWTPTVDDPAELSNLDDLLWQIVGHRLQRHEQPKNLLERARYGIQDVYQLGHRKAIDEDYKTLTRRVLRRFQKHVKVLKHHFPNRQLRPLPAELSQQLNPITREELTEEIALDMFERQILYTVASELEYRPILLRVLDDARPELLEDPHYPKALVAACEASNEAVPFPLLLNRELDEIDQSRLMRRSEASPPAGPTLATRRAFDRCLLGLALSGGGIRSATFSLGVLQGLASHGWLRQIDYLSTVSGGGYIGSWLLAWIKRRGSVMSVEESLRGYHPGTDAQGQTPARNPDPGAEHIRPIRLLREYSNYLAPVVGAFSADTWTMVSIWLRNTVLNLVVLMLFLMAVLIAPRLLGMVFVGTDLTYSLVSFAVALGLSSVFIGFNLGSFHDQVVATESSNRWWHFGPRLKPSERGDTSLLVIASIAAPTFVAVFFALRAMWEYGSMPRSDGDWGKGLVFAWGFGSLFIGLALTALFGGQALSPARGARRFESSTFERLARNLSQGKWSILWSFLAAAIGGLILMELWDHLIPILQAESRRGIWLIIAFGPSVLLAIIMLTLVLYLGLEGLDAVDERREWWSRLGAWLGIVGVGWATLASISYFAPYGVAILGMYAGTLSIGWGAFTGLGAWLGSGGKSNGVNLPLDRNPITGRIIAWAPFLFMLGFLICVAVMTHIVMILLQNHGYFGRGYTSLTLLPFSLRRYADTYWAFLDPHSRWVAVLCVALAGAAVMLARRVDVNEFSMHHFYKNRLVRAYLGASRSRLHRRPNAFTGLDMDDDIKLWRFSCHDASTRNDDTSDCRAGFCGPYPIINATLNMTTGDELAWQERKGQSFVFTPLYCGFDFATKQTTVAEKVAAQFAYRPTRYFAAGNGSPAEDAGLGIGTAIAISGAAANPNAGYHTSPAVAFLLTVFNARLGWWIGNPRLSSWTSPSPKLGLFYLLSELFGFSGVARHYVNLSDGGHFDNMGLYELVRRRCRCIIVCDAEQDDRYSFNGLAGAIRKCRIDFGVIIELSTDGIKPAKDSKLSQVHFAIGKITYPGESRSGTLIYLKASLTGDEPADVQEYAERHTEDFPHQTTADQFFDESQFESYRALGQHVADQTFPTWVAPGAEVPAGMPGSRGLCTELEPLLAQIEMRAEKRRKQPGVEAQH